MTVWSVVFVLLGFVFSGVAGAVAYFLPVIMIGLQQVGQKAEVTAAAATPSLRAPTARPTAPPPEAPPFGSSAFQQGVFVR